MATWHRSFFTVTLWLSCQNRGKAHFNQCFSPIRQLIVFSLFPDVSNNLGTVDCSNKFSEGRGMLDLEYDYFLEEDKMWVALSRIDYSPFWMGAFIGLLSAKFIAMRGLSQAKFAYILRRFYFYGFFRRCHYTLLAFWCSLCVYSAC